MKMIHKRSMTLLYFETKFVTSKVSRNILHPNKKHRTVMSPRGCNCNTSASELSNARESFSSSALPSRSPTKTRIFTGFHPQFPRTMASSTEDFYLRYYVGHKGKFGHEFLEFEFRPDGKLRYANNSNYKNDTMIRKEAYVHQSVMEELKRVIVDSEIMQEDDSLWPPPDRVGRQVNTTVLLGWKFCC